MNLGRKKKREQAQIEDESSNDLFQNKHLLEYQNKSLGTIIDKLKEELQEKNNNYLELESKLNYLVKYFTNLNITFSQLSEYIVTIAKDNKYASLSKEIIIFQEEFIGSLIRDINSNKSQNQVLEDNTSKIIENIFNSLISYLNAFVTTHEIKNNSETQSSSTNDYKALKTRYEELQNNYFELNEQNKINLKEIFLLKSKSDQFIEDLKIKEAKIEELNTKNFNLSRRLATHPSIPYINFEKKLFNKMADNHNCICHICGGELNLTKQKSELIIDNNQKTNNDVVMTDVNEENEKTLLNNEITNLKERISLLIEENEKMKLEDITEEKLLKSKAFQLLVSQAEYILTQFDSLKDANIELQKEKADLQRETEKEIKQMELKLFTKRQECDKVIFDLKKVIEGHLVTISTLNMKIESLENSFKNKETFTADINYIVDTFEQEKQKLIRQLDLIKQQKKEYFLKYEEENLKNVANDKLFIKLSSDVEKYRQALSKYENPDKEEKIEKFDIKEREKMKRDLKKKDEKISMLEKFNKDLKTELQAERENCEKFIVELEVNEKGLDELNKKLKTMTIQLSEKDEKIAKMTNEKIKDMNTIKLLNDERDSMDKRIKDLEEIKEDYIVYLKKIENNLNHQTEINNKLQEESNIKGNQIELLNKEMSKLTKKLEQSIKSQENTELALKKSTTELAKHAGNYEQMRAKYEELFKLKNNNELGKQSTEGFDEKTIKELEILRLENEKYKVIINFTVLEYGQMQSM